MNILGFASLDVTQPERKQPSGLLMAPRRMATPQPSLTLSKNWIYPLSSRRKLLSFCHKKTDLSWPVFN